MCCRAVKLGIDRLMSKMKTPSIAASLLMRQLPCGCSPVTSGLMDDKHPATGLRPLFD